MGSVKPRPSRGEATRTPDSSPPWRRRLGPRSRGAREAQQAVWLLAFGYYLFLISVMANHVALGMKKPELEMRRSLLVGTLNLGLSASLIPLIGFAGAPLGTALALAAGSWYLIRSLHLEFGRPFSVVFDMVRRPALAGLPVAGGALLIYSMVGESGSSALLGLAGSALLIGIVYLWLGVRDEVVTRECLTWQALPSVVALAALAGLATALVRSLVRQSFRAGERLPFGPHLGAATWLVWLYGPVVAG